MKRIPFAVLGSLTLSITSALAGNNFATATSTSGGYSTWDADLINIDKVTQTGSGVYVAVLDSGLVPNWRDYFPRARIAENLGTGFEQAVVFRTKNGADPCGLLAEVGTLRQTTLARQVGNQSEFELLRAKVTRDNQLPQVIQRRTDRDLAYLRLKQLLNLSYAEPVRLTTDIDDQSLAPVQLVANTTLRGTTPDTSADARASVRQLEEGLKAQEAQLQVAKSEWIPTVSLTSAYSRVAFGSGGIPAWGNWLNNWTVSLGASFPIFTGGRVRGEQLIAQAALDRAFPDQASAGTATIAFSRPGGLTDTDRSYIAETAAWLTGPSAPRAVADLVTGVVGAVDHPELAPTLNALGRVALHDADLDRAAKMFERARAVTTDRPGEGEHKAATEGLAEVARRRTGAPRVLARR